MRIWFLYIIKIIMIIFFYNKKTNQLAKKVVVLYVVAIMTKILYSTVQCGYACTVVNYVTVHLIAVILRNHENLVQLYGLIHKKFNWNCAIRFQIKIMSCACLFNKYNKRYFMYKTTFIFSPVYSECVQMNTVNQWTGCGVKMNLKQSNWVWEGHPPSVKKKKQAQKHG